MPHRLVVSTPTDREIIITRHFDAPRVLIYRCYVEPDLMRRWLLGPPGWTMPICEIDCRLGGVYRFIWRSESGEAFGITGTFREIIPSEKLVSTEIFVGATEETRVVVDFLDDGVATSVRYRLAYPSRTARDAAIASGMTDGMEMGFKRLDQFAGASPA